MDWPKNNYIDGTKITYSCPYKKITNDELLTGIQMQENSVVSILCSSAHIVSKIQYHLHYIAEQYVQCMYDKDTDEMVWYPDEIEECGRKLNITNL